MSGSVENNNLGPDPPPVLGLGDADLEWCQTCANLRQEMAEMKTQHMSSYKMLKDKIIQTDKLIKCYTSKSQEYDAATKKLEEMTRKYEQGQREAQVLSTKLKEALEQEQPLRRMKEKLERRCEGQEHKLADLRNKVSAFEAGAAQMSILQKKNEEECVRIEKDNKEAKSTINKLNTKIKGLEATIKKNQEEMQQKKSELIAMRKKNTVLANTNKSLVEKNNEYMEILSKHGLLKGKKRRKIISAAASPTMSDTLDLVQEMSDVDNSSDEDGDDDARSSVIGRMDVEDIFEELGIFDGPSKPGATMLRPISPALSPLPPTPAHTPLRTASVASYESSDSEYVEDEDDDDELLAEELEDKLLRPSPIPAEAVQTRLSTRTQSSKPVPQPSSAVRRSPRGRSGTKTDDNLPFKDFIKEEVKKEKDIEEDLKRETHVEGNKQMRVLVEKLTSVQKSAAAKVSPKKAAEPNVFFQDTEKQGHLTRQSTQGFKFVEDLQLSASESENSEDEDEIKQTETSMSKSQPPEQEIGPRTRRSSRRLSENSQTTPDSSGEGLPRRTRRQSSMKSPEAAVKESPDEQRRATRSRKQCEQGTPRSEKSNNEEVEKVKELSVSVDMVSPKVKGRRASSSSSPRRKSPRLSTEKDHATVEKNPEGQIEKQGEPTAFTRVKPRTRSSDDNSQKNPKCDLGEKRAGSFGFLTDAVAEVAEEDTSPEIRTRKRGTLVRQDSLQGGSEDRMDGTDQSTNSQLNASNTEDKGCEQRDQNTGTMTESSKEEVAEENEQVMEVATELDNDNIDRDITNSETDTKGLVEIEPDILDVSSEVPLEVDTSQVSSDTANEECEDNTEMLEVLEGDNEVQDSVSNDQEMDNNCKVISSAKANIDASMKTPEKQTGSISEVDSFTSPMSMSTSFTLDSPISPLPPSPVAQKKPTSTTVTPKKASPVVRKKQPPCMKNEPSLRAEMLRQSPKLTVKTMKNRKRKLRERALNKIKLLGESQSEMSSEEQASPKVDVKKEGNEKEIVTRRTRSSALQTQQSTNQSSIKEKVDSSKRGSKKIKTEERLKEATPDVPSSSQSGPCTSLSLLQQYACTDSSEEENDMEVAAISEKMSPSPVCQPKPTRRKSVDSKANADSKKQTTKTATQAADGKKEPEVKKEPAKRGRKSNVEKDLEIGAIKQSAIEAIPLGKRTDNVPRKMPLKPIPKPVAKEVVQAKKQVSVVRKSEQHGKSSPKISLSEELLQKISQPLKGSLFDQDCQNKVGAKRKSVDAGDGPPSKVMAGDNSNSNPQSPATSDSEDSDDEGPASPCETPLSPTMMEEDPLDLLDQPPKIIPINKGEVIQGQEEMEKEVVVEEQDTEEPAIDHFVHEPKQRVSHIKDPSKFERPKIGKKKSDVQEKQKKETIPPETKDKTQTDDLDDIPLSVDQKTSKDFKRPLGAKKTTKKTVEKAEEANVEASSENVDDVNKDAVEVSKVSQKEVNKEELAVAKEKRKDVQAPVTKEERQIYDPKEFLKESQIKEIEKNLQFVLRFASLDMMARARTLVEAGVHAERYLLQRILTILQNREQVIEHLHANVNKVAESDQPVLHETESRLLSLVLAVNMVGLLKSNFIEEFINEGRSILLSKDLKACTTPMRAAICRAIVALCRNFGDVERVRVLLYDVIYHKSLSYTTTIMAASSVWPYVFTGHGGTWLPQTIKFVVIDCIYGKPKTVVKPRIQAILNSLKVLCKWQRTEDNSADTMAEALLFALRYQSSQLATLEKDVTAAWKDSLKTVGEPVETRSSAESGSDGKDDKGTEGSKCDNGKESSNTESSDTDKSCSQTANHPKDVLKTEWKKAQSSQIRRAKTTIYEIHKALELIAIYKDWAWVNDKLIVGHVWTQLKAWAMKEGNVCESYAIEMIKLIGSLTFLALRETPTCKNNLGMLSALLQQPNMSAPVQFAIIQSLLQMAPLDAMTIFPVLHKWCSKSPPTPPPALKQDIHEFYRHFGPHLNLRQDCPMK